MRRILEVVSLLALVALAAMTADALVGPRRLPAQIPIHYNAAGQVNGWGPSQSLLGLLLGSVVLYALMSMVARRPSVFNFPARVTPMNRPRLEALAVQMISWLKAEVVCLFAWIQYFTIQAARSGHGALPAGFMPVALGVVFGTTLVYFVMFRKTSA
jgi:uncharacterized membrane protein